MVYIPSVMRKFAAGQAQVEAPGATVRKVIDHLELTCAGIKDWLVKDGRLKSNISVAIDGEVTPLGLIERVEDTSEIHFVAAISGGN